MTQEKILIISDLHLTVYFRPKKFEYLKKLFQSADRIIINGDFWTAYYNTFDEFLKTKWSGLFPILKSKSTIYLYGNHDKKIWLDERALNFSIKNCEEYMLEVGGVRYRIIHGHQFSGDSISSESYMSTWRKYKFDFWKYLIETAFLRTFGRYFYMIAKLMNNKVKEFSKKAKDYDYLVMGHTHWAEIDEKNKYINTGLIHSGVATYLVIEGNTKKIVYERY